MVSRLIVGWGVALSAMLPWLADELRDSDGPVVSVPLHPLETGVGADLNRALRLVRNQSVSASSVVDSIVRLGPAVIEPSLIAIDERQLPAIDGEKLQILSEAQEARVLDALRQLDHGLVWLAIDAHLLAPKGKRPTVSACAAAVLAGGTCADPKEFARVLACAGVTKEAELAAALERAVRISAEDIFRRNPEGLALLPGKWSSLPQVFLPALLQGVGAIGDSRALPFLEEMLGQPGDLERIAMAELALQRAPAGVSASLLEELRSRLDPDHPAICQAACNALGALGDFGSVEALGALLSDDSEGVQANAHHALCVISGLALPPQAASWRTWRLHESAWFEEREAPLTEAIAHGNKRQAIEALKEVGLHRWERHALSDIAAQGLSRSEPELVSKACEVLKQLDSPRARNALQHAAESNDPACARIARAALAALPVR